MFKKLFFISVASLALCVAGFAQTSNSNTSGTSNTSGGRTTTAAGRQDATTPAETPATNSRARRASTRAGAQSAATEAVTRAVRDAFDTLIDGIRKADVDTVMSVYWNSPQLVLFNNNGTVTRSWEQVRSNRTSLYSRVQDVKLDVRDVRVQLLGRDAAVVTCLWKQSQTTDGKPENASGRLSLAFQSIGGKWRAVHAHTSPDRPDPSLLMPSERTTETEPAKPAAKP